MFRAWLELARISNLPTVWTNVAAGWLLMGGGWDARLGWLWVAGSLLYTGGMILNDAADVRYDREHRRERPIPSGRVGAATAWGVGLGMLGVGGFLAVWLASASALTIALLIACILFYDFYHKPWSGAVWVMGACRTLLVLMAASALGDPAAGESDPAEVAVLRHALALGAYIVGLTLVARAESAPGGVSTVARIFARMLLLAPALLALGAVVGEPTRLVPTVGLVLLFLVWTEGCLRLIRRGGPAIGRAVGWLLAGIPLVDALTVGQVSLPLAAGFVALAPLLRLWQRWIAAT
jgi:hypothetical protein